MKLIIDIPKEFETDYNGDKFKDFFSRVLCDIEKGKCLCGNHEIETAEMFLKAFDKSVPMANILEKLEEEKEKAQEEMERCIFKGLPYYDSAEGKVIGINTAINIVKQEINNGLE
jgi:hypothetical protein